MRASAPQKNYAAAGPRVTNTTVVVGGGSPFGFGGGFGMGYGMGGMGYGMGGGMGFGFGGILRIFFLVTLMTVLFGFIRSFMSGGGSSGGGGGTKKGGGESWGEL
eukprot:gene485-1891_t